MNLSVLRLFSSGEEDLSVRVNWKHSQPLRFGMYLTRKLKLCRTDRLDRLAGRAGDLWSTVAKWHWRFVDRQGYWLSKGQAQTLYCKGYDGLHSQSAQAVADSFYDALQAWHNKSTLSWAPSNVDSIPSTVKEMNIRVLLFSGCLFRFHQCDLYTKLVSGVRHSMVGSQHRKVATVGRSKMKRIQGPKCGLVRRHPLSSPNVLVLFNRHDLVQSPSHMCAEEILHAFGIVG
nr:hypothetical protein [Salinibacter sp.]